MWRGDHDASRQAYWWNVEILDHAGERLAPVGASTVSGTWARYRVGTVG